MPHLCSSFSFGAAADHIGIHGNRGQDEVGIGDHGHLLGTIAAFAELDRETGRQDRTDLGLHLGVHHVEESYSVGHSSAP